jgi:two-component system chemotaxis response regulator CheB
MVTPSTDASCAVAIGASAGGLPALEHLVSGLPADFPAAILVVLHLDRRHKSLLPTLLGRHARLPVKHATPDEVIESGVVYIAVPDLHLQAADHHIRLMDTGLVHFTRPAVDRLFESVALAYRESAIGIVLTGTGSDGSDGVVAIRRAGGTTIAQDPADAAYPSMPLAAIATGCVDLVLPLAEIAPTLARVCAAAVRRAGG